MRRGEKYETKTRRKTSKNRIVSKEQKALRGKYKKHKAESMRKASPRCCAQESPWTILPQLILNAPSLDWAQRCRKNFTFL